jgi:hypothetical protein
MTLVMSLHRSHFISVTVNFPKLYRCSVWSDQLKRFRIRPDRDHNIDRIKEISVEEKSSCCGRRQTSVVFCADSSILQTYQLGECHRQEVGASFQVGFFISLGIVHALIFYCHLHLFLIVLDVLFLLNGDC